MPSYFNSYAEVSLPTIKSNCEKILAHTQRKIIPVLKANAYGMGLIPMAQYLCQNLPVDLLACAQTSEAVALRSGGLTDVGVLIIGPVPAHALSAVVAGDIQLPVFREDSARSLNEEAEKQGKIARIHIKIESGMNRIGVHIGEELDRLLQVLDTLPHLEVVGVFTHFVQADVRQDPFTLNQFDIFQQGVSQIQHHGISPQYIHCCNTCATEWFTEAIAFSTHVRVGSLFYGYSDMADGSNPINVVEPLSWRAYITTIKTVAPGQSIGYGQYFKPEKPTTIATISVGTGDGIYTHFAKNQGAIMVNDTVTKFLDTCMDQSFVDVTGIPCAVGDEVTIFGYSKNGVLLSPESFASYGQIYTTYMTSMSHRVERIYITE